MGGQKHARHHCPVSCMATAPHHQTSDQRTMAACPARRTGMSYRSSGSACCHLILIMSLSPLLPLMVCGCHYDIVRSVLYAGLGEIMLRRERHFQVRDTAKYPVERIAPPQSPYLNIQRGEHEARAEQHRTQEYAPGEYRVLKNWVHVFLLSHSARASSLA